MTYTLELTNEEVATLHFVGHRYAWAPPLEECLISEKGANVVFMTECEAWEWCDEVNEEGGTFPLASPEFAVKLYSFMDSII